MPAATAVTVQTVQAPVLSDYTHPDTGSPRRSGQDRDRGPRA